MDLITPQAVAFIMATNIVAFISIIVAFIVIIKIMTKTHQRLEMTQTQLLNRIMSRDLREYAQTNRYASTNPEDEKDLMKLENDLVIGAQAIQQGEDEKEAGIPIDN
jgi:hypothetical protein